MKIDNDKLNRIYDKTRGKCHLCHKQLSFKNYAQPGARGDWEVEHSKPRSKGGTDHLNNLFAACMACNREKSNSTNYSVRSKKGVKKAPLSYKAKKNKIIKNTVIASATGAAIGRILGPGGMIVGGVIGVFIGKNKEIDK